ncbi:MAG: putative short chain dehydrogenase [Aeromicrobium sp.]|nr:putative short chain dehydrogenase [Aeromicrobium sp.]
MTGAAGARSALVTGGSRGIGLGVASSLARQGFGLTITARDAATLLAVATDLRALGAAHVVTVAADLADREASERIVQEHASEFGSMDVLVLNAGVGTAGAIADYPMKRFDKTVDVNLRAPFEMLQRAMPLLRAAAAANPERGAKVIALSSLTGVYAEAGLAAYGATKAAMLSLVETLNAEESASGISGTALAPGYVETDMSAWIQDKIPADTMIRVEDIVELVDGVLRLSSRAVVSTIAITRAGAGLQA